MAGNSILVQSSSSKEAGLSEVFQKRAFIYEPQDFGKVAVLYGGRSAERAVSLESGKAVLSALLEQGIDAHGIDTADDPLSKLIAGQFDRAFVVLHGPEGEDGAMQGLLQILGIPYTGSNVAASALAMDKKRTKLVWNALGLPTAPFGLVQNAQEALHVGTTIGFPIVVKPANQGSSVGVFKVESPAQLPQAFAKSAVYGSVLIEPWITGREFTVGIINNKVLPVIEIITDAEFFDYHAKYEADTRLECPAKISPEEANTLQNLALRAYQALGCEGWGRVDVLQDKEGQFWLLEVNTIPGMTSHSLVPMAARGLGLSFSELVRTILEITIVPEMVQV